MGMQTYFGDSPEDAEPPADPIPLYSRHSRKEALSFFSGKGKSVCDGQWVEFPDAVAGFMRIGQEPAIHFCDALQFHWYAEKPYGPWSDGQHEWHIPRGLVQARDKKTPIGLFVQIGDADLYAYV